MEMTQHHLVSFTVDNYIFTVTYLENPSSLSINCYNNTEFTEWNIQLNSDVYSASHINPLPLKQLFYLFTDYKDGCLSQSITFDFVLPVRKEEIVVQLKAWSPLGDEFSFLSQIALNYTKIPAKTRLIKKNKALAERISDLNHRINALENKPVNTIQTNTQSQNTPVGLTGKRKFNSNKDVFNPNETHFMSKDLSEKELPKRVLPEKRIRRNDKISDFKPQTENTFQSPCKKVASVIPETELPIFVNQQEIKNNLTSPSKIARENKFASESQMSPDFRPLSDVEHHQHHPGMYNSDLNNKDLPEGFFNLFKNISNLAGDELPRFVRQQELKNNNTSPSKVTKENKFASQMSPDFRPLNDVEHYHNYPDIYNNKPNKGLQEGLYNLLKNGSNPANDDLTKLFTQFSNPGSQNQSFESSPTNTKKNLFEQPSLPQQLSSEDLSKKICEQLFGRTHHCDASK